MFREKIKDLFLNYKHGTNQLLEAPGQETWQTCEYYPSSTLDIGVSSSFGDAEQSLLQGIGSFLEQHPETAILPDEIKFKRVRNNLIALWVPPFTANNEQRKKVFDARYAKFRAAKAFVLCILNLASNRLVSECINESIVLFQKTLCLRYQTFEWVFPDSFESLRDVICGPGIHYFNSLEAAYAYNERVHSNFSINFQDNGRVCHYCPLHERYCILIQEKWQDRVEQLMRCEQTNHLLSEEDQEDIICLKVEMHQRDLK